MLSVSEVRCQLTAIVNFHDMGREAPRTLATLTASYQRGVTASDYDVIAIDNGSSKPLSEAEVRGFGPNFSLVQEAGQSASPVGALNRAVRAAHTPWVLCIIDGARMLSPGLMAKTLMAMEVAAEPFVYTIGMHLGPESQNKLVERGWSQADEDRLLASADWIEDGYRLFELSSLASSSANGFLGPVSESNAFALRRDTFLAVEGFDERFVAPGGGLANLDFFKRVVTRPSTTTICLLGEATFHQIHGGVATNVPKSAHPWNSFAEEYERLQGERYSAPRHYRPLFAGNLAHTPRHLLHPTALTFLQMRRLPSSARLTELPVRPLRTFARSRGLAYEEIKERPGPYACLLENVGVSSRSSFLLAQGSALLDHHGDDQGMPPFLALDSRLSILGEAGLRVITDPDARPERHVDEAFLLVGVNTDSLVKWLFEYLPKVVLCQTRPWFESIPFLLDEGMPLQHREALRFFAGPDHPFVEVKHRQSVLVARLWVCSGAARRPDSQTEASGGSSVDLPVDEATLNALRGRVAGRLDAARKPPGPKRIFVTGHDSRGRRLVNRSEIETWFHAHSFCVLDQTSASFRDQIAWISGADVLVVADDLGRPMSLFARTGTRIGMLTADEAEGARFANACRAAGHYPVVLAGRGSTDELGHHGLSAYRIEVEDLPRLLDDLVSRDDPRRRARQTRPSLGSLARRYIRRIRMR